MRVALATAAAIPGLTRDDRRLYASLAAEGIDVRAVVWEDAYEAWDAYDLCVVRSCWDYAYRRDVFLSWVDRVEAVTRVWNPASVVRWNTHKGYLLDLAAEGVPTVPTVLLQRGEDASLEEVLDSRGWVEAVAKPAVGASGRLTRRVARATLGEAEEHFARVLQFEDLVVQPFVPSIVEHGELSVVWIDGVVTHAVRKRAGGGEFRVQHEWGGTVAMEDPPDDAVALSERAMQGRPGARYGRVDMVHAPDGSWQVMELELVEPELFFDLSDTAVRRMTEAIRVADDA